MCLFSENASDVYLLFVTEIREQDVAGIKEEELGRIGSERRWMFSGM